MQINFVKKQLRAINVTKKETKTVRKFTEHYLKRDGLLIVRLVAKNAGELVAAELLHGLWVNYGPERRSTGDAHDGNGNGRRQGRPLMSQDIV